MTGEMPAEGVNPVEMPREAEHVWNWFLLLNAEREVGMGLSPLGSEKITSFFNLEFRGQYLPDGWELSALRAIDRAYMKFNG